MEKLEKENDTPGRGMKRTRIPQAPHGGSFGNYMKFKRIKLKEQFENSSSPNDKDKGKQLFSNKCFWVNGLTNPSLSKLKPLILSNGGSLEMTLTPLVNHIIADNLTLSKTKSLSHQTVTKASWITQSLLHEKLVPIADHSLSSPSVSISPTKQEGSFRGSTLTDPNFVSNYFKSSRLHFLGAFKDHISSLLDDTLLLIPARYPIPSPPNPCIYLHIDMDCFFASIAMRDDPSLQSLPIAVTHNSSSSYSNNSISLSTADISSCNYIARRFGVKAGMSVGKARKLCPQLKTVPYCFEAYLEASDAIYSIFFGISHNVEIVSCDEVFIGIGLDQLGNGMMERSTRVLDLAEEIRELVYSATGCTASVGISHNILLARLATSKAKPDGVFYLSPSPEVISSFLDELDPSCLPGMGWNHSKTLKNMSIDSCKQLKAISLQTLQSNFGNSKGQMLYNYCRGIDQRPIKTGLDRASISVEIGWGVRFEKRAQVLKFVSELSEELCRRLDRACRRTGMITLKVKKAKDPSKEASKFMGHGRCDQLSKSVRTDIASSRPSDITSLCIRALDMLYIPPEHIRAVGICASKLVNGSISPSSLGKPISSFFTPLNSTQVRKAQKKVVPKKSDKIVPSSSSSSAVPPTKKKSYVSNSSVHIDDIDPSILKELPDDIVRELMGQRMPKKVTKQKAFQKAEPKPGKVTSVFKQSKPKLKRAKDSPRNGKISFTSANMGKRGNGKGIDVHNLDPSVLEQLPLRIRREVEQSFSKQKKIDSFFSVKTSNVIDTYTPPVEEEPCPKEHSLVIDTLTPQSLAKLFISMEGKFDLYALQETVSHQLKLKNSLSLEIALRMYKRTGSFLHPHHSKIITYTEEAIHVYLSQ